jgi:hypothetical protein
MVLEEAVILERDAANSPKNCAFHEVVGVGAELCKEMSDLDAAMERYILRQ